MEHSPASLRDLSVLVVEDNAFTSQLVATVLRKMGIERVFEAATARSAFTILGARPVDVILCDLEMEPMSGLAFIQRLRSGQPPEDMTLPRLPDPATPVIVLTAHTAAKTVERARDVGATAFLGKPVNPNLIRQRIEAIVATAGNRKDDVLHRVVYCSKPSPGFAKQDIKTILSASQKRNPARNISGALCFNTSHFLQILEGPRRTLEALYTVIAADPRHHDLRTIFRGAIDARETEGWSMLFLGADPAMVALYQSHCGGDRFTPEAMDATQAMSFLAAVIEHCRQR